MTIGEQLRNARRARGITIEQIASVTKISPSVLRALEADDLAKLPGWVFTRGFLKAYAREVGLDPHETVVGFLAQIAPPEEEDEEGTRTSRASQETTHVLLPTEHSTDLGQMVAVAVIVIAAVAYLGLHKRSTAAAQTSEPMSSSAPVSPAALDTPVATAGFALPTPVASEAPDLKADLTATGPCWVAATADAELRMQRLMNAGDHETVTARDTLTLRVGDPAALTLSLNGAPGRSLGQAGQPVTVTITSQNYRDYLAR